MGMAKRSCSKKGRNMEPAVMTMSFNFQVPTQGVTNNYLDLSQVASLVNRRFYRQGINWAVSGFKFLTSGSSVGSIQIQKLPNTWVMSNSWEKSFRSWQRMNNEALAESESVRPKFLDFKIYADEDHHSAGFIGNLLPLSGTSTQAIPGEWSSSKISVPLVSPAGAFSPGETVERELIATGASYPGASATTGFDAVSLIEGYAASRGLPNIADPNTPDDAGDTGGGTPENWMQAIFNEGTDQSADVIEDMITENTIAPYPFEGDGVNLDTMYPGGANQLDGLQLHDVEFITATTIGGTSRLKGGNFPCGLVKVITANLDDTNVLSVTMQVDLVPGSHRGYLCEPMSEM